MTRAWTEAVSGKRMKRWRCRDGTQRHLGVKGTGQMTNEMWCMWETSPFSHKHLWVKQHSDKEPDNLGSKSCLCYLPTL